LGGAKKRGLGKIEKAQRLQTQKEKSAKKKGKPTPEKKPQTPKLPSFDDKSLVSELEKMRAITPSTVASTYGIRISFAKDFLEELEKRRMISLVIGCRRLKIYRPITPSS